MEIADSLEDFRNKLGRFVQFPDSEWELVTPYVQIMDLKKHQAFAMEGKRSHDFAFVTSGTFRQYYTKDGEERTTYFFFTNDLLCAYVSCLTGQPSQLTIEALTDASLLTFPYRVLVDLYKQSFAWHTFGRMIAEYIAIGLEERMVGLLLQSPEERYRELIDGPKEKIIKQIPQQYIASYLGITPVSMSRIRKRLME